MNTAGTGAAAIALTSTGGVTIIADSATSAVIKGDHESGTAVHADANQAAASRVLIDAGTLDVDSTAAITLDAGAASNFTTTGALTLNGASCVNIQGNAAEIDITTTGALDINAAATTIDSSAGVDITAANASSFKTTSGGLDIIGADGQTKIVNTDGKVLLNANSGVYILGNAAEIDITTSALLDINAATIDIDASSAFTLDATTIDVVGSDNTSLTANGEAKNLTLAAVGGGSQVLAVNSAGTGTNAIDINATAGGIDIDAEGAISIDSNAGVAISAATASSLTTSAGALTLTGAAASTWSTGAGALTLDGAGGVNINCNTSEKMRITTTGNVGIGTDTPTSYYATGNEVSTIYNNYSANDRILKIHNSDELGLSRLVLSGGNHHTTSIFGQHTGSGATVLGFQTTAGGAAGTTGMTVVERMRIDNLGNVGIGRTDPKARLHVYDDSTKSEIYLGEINQTNKAGFLKYLQGGGDGGTDGKLLFGNWGDNLDTDGEGLVILKGGNVGIGTSTPSATLEVNGNSIMTGALTVNATSLNEKISITNTANGDGDAIALTSTAGGINLTADSATSAVVIKGDHTNGTAIHIDGDADANSIVDIDAGKLDIDCLASIDMNCPFHGGEIKLNTLNAGYTQQGTTNGGSIGITAKTGVTVSTGGAGSTGSKLAFSNSTGNGDNSIELTSTSGGITLTGTNAYTMETDGDIITQYQNNKTASIKNAADNVKIVLDDSTDSSETITLTISTGTGNNAIGLTSALRRCYSNRC